MQLSQQKAILLNSLQSLQVKGQILGWVDLNESGFFTLTRFETALFHVRWSTVDVFHHTVAQIQLNLH